MEMVISPKTAVVFPPGTEVEPRQTTTKDQTKPRARGVPTVRSTVKERRRKLEDKEEEAVRKVGGIATVATGVPQPFYPNSCTGS